MATNKITFEVDLQVNKNNLNELNNALHKVRLDIDDMSKGKGLSEEFKKAADAAGVLNDALSAS